VVGRGHPVRQALVDLELRTPDQFAREHRAGADGDNLVVVAVYDQRRDVDLPEVLGEVDRPLS
jgi:hypothetical protein